MVHSLNVSTFGDFYLLVMGHHRLLKVLVRLGWPPMGQKELCDPFLRIELGEGEWTQGYSSL